MQELIALGAEVKVFARTSAAKAGHPTSPECTPKGVLHPRTRRTAPENKAYSTREQGVLHPRTGRYPVSIVNLFSCRRYLLLTAAPSHCPVQSPAPSALRSPPRISGSASNPDEPAPAAHRHWASDGLKSGPRCARC